MDPLLVKSLSGSVTNKGPIISKYDVGRRVVVGGAICGTLKYVGPVIGKDGVFCGVELDFPEGKHNGSFQGVAYFQCPPQHGIFAPLYKVELDASGSPQPNKNPMTISQLKRPTKLVKSSIATFRSPTHSMMISQSESIPERDVVRSGAGSIPNSMFNSTASTSGIMDVSMMSTASSTNFMDNSLIMNASGVGEEMVTSNATYVICRGVSAGRANCLEPEESLQPREDEIMNVSEPDLPITLSDESDEDEFIIAANYKNGNTPFGATYEEDDLKTPMAEFYAAPSLTSAPPVAPPSAPPSSDSASQRSLSEMSVDTGYHGESDASLLSAGSSFRGAEESEKDKSKPITPIKEENEATATSPAKPKKIRVSLLEQIQKPVESSRPRAPKPLSKHQEMMAKLKASIAADKLKPKKEVKSKLAVSIAPAPAPPPQQATANGEMAPAADGAPTPKRPVRTLNGVSKMTSKMPPPPPPRAPKPRQPLYVAPPPKERPPRKAKEDAKQVIAATVSRAGSQASIRSTSTTATTRSRVAPPAPTSKAKAAFPTSSFAPSTSKVSKKTAAPPPAPKVSKAEAEAKQKAEAVAALERLKEERLQKAVSYGDAMVLLYNREASGARKASDENARLRQLIEHIQSDMEELKEDAARREQRLSKSYEERISEIQRNNEGEEERWQEETAKIHRQHQLKCAELDGKLADASEQVEKLKKDKRKLEATLNEDEATKIKTLSAEIQSLNMALEMKSEEMKDMRQKNATLLLRVEEIPCKEQEIQKLKYKVRECTQEISRLRETEKTLTNEYEDLQRSAKKFVAKSEQIAKENDLLRYRMEEQAPLTQSLMETPVRFRSARPGGFSASMSAAIPTRNTQSTYGDLMGSTEELQRSIISMYQSRGRPQSCNVDTIYAPEGTYEGDTFEEDENTHLEHERCMKAVIDSGIGLAQHH